MELNKKGQLTRLVRHAHGVWERGGIITITHTVPEAKFPFFAVLQRGERKETALLSADEFRLVEDESKCSE